MWTERCPSKQQNTGTFVRKPTDSSEERKFCLHVDQQTADAHTNGWSGETKKSFKSGWTQTDDECEEV